MQAFLPDMPAVVLKVRTVAAKSKSWSENGVDVVAMIERAHAIDRRLGAMLYLCVAFGLRRQEQVMIQPHRADAGTFLKIRDNIVKSGRDRDVPIQRPFQRAALDRAKQVARRGLALGWPGGTLKQNLARYSYLLRERLHISRKESHCVAHGLRAEYAENVMMLAGLIPPVLGGARDQMSLDERRAIQGQLSENMGTAPSGQRSPVRTPSRSASGRWWRRRARTPCAIAAT